MAKVTKRKYLINGIIKTATQIVEGTIKSIITSKDTEELHTKRMEVCKACVAFKDGICSSKVSLVNTNGKEVKGCGCVLSIKTRVADATCPAGKW